MNSKPKPGNEHELAKGITVADYVRLKSNMDRQGIAELIRRRFRQRYLDPIISIPADRKSGFCMVAVGCLMIEALESFYQGWPSSDRKSKSAFCQFIDREPGLTLLKAHAEAFYSSVRCGILHQAETTGGWRIRRDRGGLLFEAVTKTLNANEFINALSASLEDYCRRLESAAWTDPLWINATTKLDAICAQCSA
jgi:hypothetical protein